MSIIEILERKLETKEIDDLIFIPMNELQRNVLQLQIYFGENEYTIFQEIVENVKAINTTLMEIYFSFDQESEVISKSNSFISHRNKMLNANEVLFKRLSSTLRKTFN